jgi:hypothetical protein
MDQVGKASLVAFAEEREHRSIPEFMLAQGRVYFTRTGYGNQTKTTVRSEILSR